ncbi:hypothetical protein SAMN05444266_103382 [Chitinophaga jiangningensis]|uniref:Uncharacterized protein n=1 Tax=Chitinophaga jiangningensis TaxID=1419482 RepID=A0A1M7ARE0_9BACT|nr:DUF6348 family protein [Chitinophaga jiangningensis]SHL45304.1 hypothetical protein SAMN05444266_103382 [Chitinophaga jiangningensis]
MTQAQQEQPVYVQILEALKIKLLEQHYKVNWLKEEETLLVDDVLEIAADYEPTPDGHPLVMKLVYVVIHREYFPKGIIEFLAGIGDTLEDRIDNGNNNFLQLVLPPILDSLNPTHNPDLDLVDDQDNEWHVKAGDMGLQGEWEEQPEDEVILLQLHEQLKEKLAEQSQPFCWLKVYTAINNDGTKIHECNFNNVHWEAGDEQISKIPESWDTPQVFKAIKQFVMLRRCGVEER